MFTIIRTKYIFLSPALDKYTCPCLTSQNSRGLTTCPFEASSSSKFCDPAINTNRPKWSQEAPHSVTPFLSHDWRQVAKRKEHRVKEADRKSCHVSNWAQHMGPHCLPKPERKTCHSLVSHSSAFPLPLGMKNGKLTVKSVLKEAAGKLISKEKMDQNGPGTCGRYFKRAWLLHERYLLRNFHHRRSSWE